MSPLPPLEAYAPGYELHHSLFPRGDGYDLMGLRHPDVASFDPSQRVPAWLVSLFVFGDDTGTGGDLRAELTGRTLGYVEDGYAMRACRYIGHYLEKYRVGSVLKHLGSEDPGTALYWVFDCEYSSRHHAEQTLHAARITYPGGRYHPSWRTVEREHAALVRMALDLDRIDGWRELASPLLGQRILRVRFCLSARRLAAARKCMSSTRDARSSAYKEIPYLLDACALADAACAPAGWTKRRAAYVSAWSDIFDALCSGDVGDDRCVPALETRILARTESHTYVCDSIELDA